MAQGREVQAQVQQGREWAPRGLPAQGRAQLLVQGQGWLQGWCRCCWIRGAGAARHVHQPATEVSPGCCWPLQPVLVCCLRVLQVPEPPLPWVRAPPHGPQQAQGLLPLPWVLLWQPQLRAQLEQQLC